MLNCIHTPDQLFVIYVNVAKIKRMYTNTVVDYACWSKSQSNFLLSLTGIKFKIII